MQNPLTHTVVLLEIDYFDSGSTIATFEILKTLAICHNPNHEIQMTFKWIYLKEDGAVKEMGGFVERKLDVTFDYCENTPDVIQEQFKGYN